MCHRILDYTNFHHPVAKEVLVQLERTNSKIACEKLIECHTSRSIDLTKVQQTYDTTSSMSSGRGGGGGGGGGVHGRFKALYEKPILFAL